MMDFKNAEEWGKYIYEEAFMYLKNGKIEVGIEKLRKLIDQIPTEFIEHENIKELEALYKALKELSDEPDENKSFQHTLKYERFKFLLSVIPSDFRNHGNVKNLTLLCKAIHNDVNTSEAQMLFFENELTIDNSILGKFEEPKDDVLLKVLYAWFIEARNEYERIQSFIYETRLYKSIDELELAKMEIRELNSFFESGKSNSMAIHLQKKLFNQNFTGKELYEYYLLLIRGEFDFFITKEDFIKYDEPLSKTNHTNFDTSCRDMEENLVLNKDWFLAARIQAILWIRMFLENLVKTENFSKLQLILPRISMDDLAKNNKKGFQVENPEIIPALYDVLIDFCLIKVQVKDLAKFEEAFLKGNSSIDWIGGNDQLGFFIRKIKTKKIILNRNHMQIASNIFTIDGKFPTANGLGSGAELITEASEKLIISVINKIIAS